MKKLFDVYGTEDHWHYSEGVSRAFGQNKLVQLDSGSKVLSAVQPLTNIDFTSALKSGFVKKIGVILSDVDDEPEPVSSLKSRLDKIGEVAAELDRQSLMLDSERALLLKIRELANYQELLDGSSGDLGLHTMPEYLISPYTPKDAE